MSRDKCGYPRVSEDDEQAFVLEWCAWSAVRYPVLKLIYHIPNEGKRSYAEGARQKRLGLRRGVCDLCLPAARGGYHGLYIEMKTEEGRVSREQAEFIEGILGEGYMAEVCRSGEEAVAVIERYLKMDMGENKKAGE